MQTEPQAASETKTRKQVAGPLGFGRDALVYTWECPQHTILGQCIAECLHLGAAAVLFHERSDTANVLVRLHENHRHVLWDI